MTWSPPPPDPCGPDCTCRTDAHPTGHAARSIGDHDRRQREIDTELARLRPCRCATSEAPAQCHCPPDTPSDRLPWTDRLPETPTYQTGRVPTDRAPLDPAEEFQRELVRLRPFLGPAIDQVARDLQKQDRPGIIRRILNARRSK